MTLSSIQVLEMGDRTPVGTSLTLMSLHVRGRLSSHGAVGESAAWVREKASSLLVSRPGFCRVPHPGLGNTPEVCPLLLSVRLR